MSNSERLRQCAGGIFRLSQKEEVTEQQGQIMRTVCNGDRHSANLDTNALFTSESPSQARLRAYVVDRGHERLSDAELLELLISCSSSETNCKSAANELLSEYGSLANLISTPLTQLAQIRGLPRASLGLLYLCKDMIDSILLSRLPERIDLRSATSVIEFISSKIRHAQQEVLYILFLDIKNRLIRDLEFSRGDIAYVPLFPRQIVKAALSLGASGIVMAHNHTSGDVNPSKQDIDLTKKLRRALELFDISLHDHLIIGNGTFASMRSELVI